MYWKLSNLAIWIRRPSIIQSYFIIGNETEWSKSVGVSTDEAVLCNVTGVQWTYCTYSCYRIKCHMDSLLQAERIIDSKNDVTGWGLRWTRQWKLLILSKLSLLIHLLFMPFVNRCAVYIKSSYFLRWIGCLAGKRTFQQVFITSYWHICRTFLPAWMTWIWA